MPAVDELLERVVVAVGRRHSGVEVDFGCEIGEAPRGAALLATAAGVGARGVPARAGCGGRLVGHRVEPGRPGPRPILGRAPSRASAAP